MSEKSWVLEGIDADNRQRAIAEAERLGVPIGDYLTDVVLRAALAEQAPAPELEATSADAPIGCLLGGGYHVDALERGFGLAVEALDSVVSALDGSVCGLTARVDQAEALAAATAEHLNRTLYDTGDRLEALQERLAAAEQRADAVACAQEAMGAAFAAGSASLAEQAAAAEEAARAASEATAQLAAAHEALKYAVADDFVTFARESASCLSAGLDEMRAAADTAAERADAAVSRLLQEVRAASEAVEARLCESAEETRLRVQAAFADAAERMAALAGRVTDCERLAQHGTEQLASQIADIEHDTRDALEAIRRDLSTEIAGLRAQQDEGAARLTQLDASSATLESDIAAMRRTMDARAAQAEEAVRAVLARAQAEWDARHETLRANGERIEACALAALERVANDRAAGDAALHRELADVRDQASGAAARLTLLDRAIGAGELMAAVEAGAAPLSARLNRIEASLATRGEFSAEERELDGRALRLEAAHETEATAHALAALRGQIGALAAQFDAQQIESARHLDALREQVGEAAGSAQSAMHTLEGVSAQSGQAEERLHRLEQAVADLRLEPSQAPGAGAIEDLARRVEAFEQRQQAAIEQLRGDIARLVEENAHRLEVLDQPPPSAVASEFEALRRRVEERLLDIEQRSVRALEQAADTMAALETRFTADTPTTLLRSA